jgi:serine protease AprX
MNENMFWKALTCFFVLFLLFTLGSISLAQERDSETIPNAYSAQGEEGNEVFLEVASESPLQTVKALNGGGSGFLLAASTGIDRDAGKAKDKAGLSGATKSKPAKPSAHADRDGDGLSDGLQAKLTDALPSSLVNVIVTFAGPGNVDSAHHAVGPFHVKRKFWIIPGFSANMTASQAIALAKTPGVFRVEEDFKVSATLNAANHDFGTEFARGEFGVTGSGIGICVVDTGVDPLHEQLDGGKVVDFVDQVNGHTTAYDDHGHGTHVSSIAAGDGTGGTNAEAFKGVAPGASIYAAKVLDASGSGSASDVIAGIEWCAAIADVNIISMSLAENGSSDGNDSLSQAVDTAVVDQGKIVVVAAGNGGAAPYTIGSPGASRDAITVGAVAEWSASPGSANHSDGVYLAPFSSRGPTYDNRIKPDIVAPGVSIAAAQAGSVGGYVMYSGTSMATPFVSGTIALALQDGSGLTPDLVKNLIKITAQGRGLENDWGTGLVDGYAFVAEARNETISGPTPFPTYQPISGTVSDFVEWTWTFNITGEDLNIPIGVTITIEGEPACSLGFPPDWCFAWEWSPDLDAELIDPNNNTIATSTCPLGNECESMGRQETLHAMPTTEGTYTVKVKPFADAPNNGKGGNFLLDVSTGPLAAVGGDLCPDDPNKTAPGDCGCGVADIDSDGDGTSDCIDLCPDDPNKTAPGDCGCGVADIDSDGDGTADCQDNCPIDPGKTDPGICGCGVADTDSDGDGTADCNEPSDCDSCFKGDCNGVCHPKEVGTNCPDCSSTPAEEVCDDEIDNDGDGLVDCDDIDCSNETVCQDSCLPRKELCSLNEECCSGRCFRGACK